MEPRIRGTLTKEELKHLHPDDKERYANNLINEVLRKNQGLTMSELERITKLNRSTIEKHLERLIALQVVERQVLGITAKYSFVPRAPSDRELEFHSSGDIFYSFQMLEKDGTNLVYVQQKTLDEFRAVVVKGGITIPLADIDAFLKELRIYSVAQENQFEPSQ